MHQVSARPSERKKTSPNDIVLVMAIEGVIMPFIQKNLTQFVKTIFFQQCSSNVYCFFRVNKAIISANSLYNMHSNYQFVRHAQSTIQRSFSKLERVKGRRNSYMISIEKTSMSELRKVSVVPGKRSESST